MSLPQDRSQQKRDSDRVSLLVPVIVLVLGLTAVPVELRPFDVATLSLDCIARDVAVNLILYIPVGMVLSGLGFRRALLIASLVSLVAETSQFFMMFRFPSPVDLATNIAGAMIGLLIGWRWRIEAPALRVNVRAAWLSALAALVVLMSLAILGRKDRPEWEGLSVNPRGATLPGSLEAHWTFDDPIAGVSHDSSGNGLDGTFIGGTVLADGIRGKAVRLDGEKDYVDFGRPVELRLMGSMTISAWINSASFPRDDAAIVSTLLSGYQLDTTVDTGPRTIGFKFDDRCGNHMARYGATELVRDTWYHVAGVYDADARTLDVYLNGHLDNGSLMGPVAPVHLPSSQPVCVGRRADVREFEFAGLIDDIRIYSRALTHAEIERAMNGVEVGSHPPEKVARARADEIMEKRLPGGAFRCYQPTRDEDALVPGFMVAAGMLSALTCAGFLPGHRSFLLAASLAVGLLFIPFASISLPRFFAWMFPILSLAGGASVAVSLVRASQWP